MAATSRERFGGLHPTDGLQTPRRSHGDPNLPHKTGAIVLHPLQDGDGTLSYGDAEEVLGSGTRIGSQPRRTRREQNFGMKRRMNFEMATARQQHGQIASSF